MKGTFFVNSAKTASSWPTTQVIIIREPFLDNILITGL